MISHIRKCTTLVPGTHNIIMLESLSEGLPNPQNMLYHFSGLMNQTSLFWDIIIAHAYGEKGRHGLSGRGWACTFQKKYGLVHETTTLARG